MTAERVVAALVLAAVVAVLWVAYALTQPILPAPDDEPAYRTTSTVPAPAVPARAPYHLGDPR